MRFLKTKRYKNGKTRFLKVLLKFNKLKLNNLFSGKDTYGRHIEVGVRKDGKMFWRSYVWNGYGMGMSKWSPLEETTKDIYINCYGRQAMKWGWNELTGVDSRIRLPKD